MIASPEKDARHDPNHRMTMAWVDLPGPADDVALMRGALDEARAAGEHEDVPIGAVIVRGGEVIARARNRREEARDPTGHAEILALREAGERVGSWRLVDG